MRQVLDIAAIIGVLFGGLSLVLLWRLRRLHNNLLAQFREHVKDCEYAGDPLPDEEIERLVKIATGRLPVDEPHAARDSHS